MHRAARGQKQDQLAPGGRARQIWGAGGGDQVVMVCRCGLAQDLAGQEQDAAVRATRPTQAWRCRSGSGRDRCSARNAAGAVTSVSSSTKRPCGLDHVPVRPAELSRCHHRPGDRSPGANGTALRASALSLGSGSGGSAGSGAGLAKKRRIGSRLIWRPHYALRQARGSGAVRCRPCGMTL